MMKIENLPLQGQLAAAELEDFWQRRANKLTFQREVTLFGHLLTVKSNAASLLKAVDLALPLYTKSALAKPTLGEVHLVVQPSSQEVAPVPDGLMQQIRYSGSDNWLMMQLGNWGMAHLDLTQRRATAVLDPTLAARPDLVAQCLLHTLLLNLVIAHGYGMLHASCLVHQRVALLLLAPHNSGKSTTALRLALAGFQLLTDSMVFVDGAGYLHGFPVGIAKLRGDMIAHFPALRPFLQTEIVRQEAKYRVDLRAVASDLVQETAVKPQRVILCLLSRHASSESVVAEATETAVTEAILQNSLYVDQPHIWQQNNEKLQKLLLGETAVRLTIGTDPDHLQDVIHKLLV